MKSLDFLINRKTREMPTFACLVACYALLSWISLNWFAVFVDEPGYTDPAASLLLGQGFTSGAWYAQGYETFWAGNVPLHQFLLYGWLKCFGFHLEAVRAINIVYVIIGITGVWMAMRRLDLLKSPLTRLVTVILLLCSHAGALWVNVGRPDAICVAIAGLLFFSFSLRSDYIRRGCLALLAALSLWGGIPLALVIGGTGILMLICYRRRFAADVIFLAIGGAIGAVCLVGLYMHHGVLDAFIQSLLPHSSLLGKPSQIIPPPVNGLKHKLGAMTDYTFLCLIAASASTWLKLWRSKEARPWLIANILSILGIPTLLFAIGVFPVYYAWFAFLPGVITLIGTWERFPCLHGMIGKIAVLSACAIIPLGFLRIWTTGLIYHKDHLNEKTVEFTNMVIRPDDVVLCQAQPWYGAKQRAQKVYQGLRTPNLTPAEEAQLTVIICSRNFFKAQREILTGEWREAPEHLLLPNRNTHRLPFSKWFRDNPTIDLYVFRRVQP